VLATDGLWERLDSEEVVGLVGAWLDGVRTPLSRKVVMSRVTLPPNPKPTGSPPTKSSGQDSRNRTFSFEDDNLSTHVIRNALGGANQQLLSALLSIPAPLSRRYRDDITVTVILLGQGQQATEGLQGVRRLFPKSKL